MAIKSVNAHRLRLLALVADFSKVAALWREGKSKLAELGYGAARPHSLELGDSHEVDLHEHAMLEWMRNLHILPEQHGDWPAMLAEIQHLSSFVATCNARFGERSQGDGKNPHPATADLSPEAAAGVDVNESLAIEVQSLRRELAEAERYVDGLVAADKLRLEQHAEELAARDRMIERLGTRCEELQAKADKFDELNAKIDAAQATTDQPAADPTDTPSSPQDTAEPAGQPTESP